MLKQIETETTVIEEEMASQLGQALGQIHTYGEQPENTNVLIKLINKRLVQLVNEEIPTMARVTSQINRSMGQVPPTSSDAEIPLTQRSLNFKSPELGLMDALESIDEQLKFLVDKKNSRGSSSLSR